MSDKGTHTSHTAIGNGGAWVPRSLLVVNMFYRYGQHYNLRTPSSVTVNMPITLLRIGDECPLARNPSHALMESHNTHTGI